MPANVRQCGIGGQWRRQAGFPPANAGGVWGVNGEEDWRTFRRCPPPSSWCSSAHHGGSIGGTLADFTPPQPGLAAASRGGRWPARRATLDRLRLCPAPLRRSPPMSAHGIGGPGPVLAIPSTAPASCGAVGAVPLPPSSWSSSSRPLDEKHSHLIQTSLNRV